MRNLTVVNADGKDVEVVMKDHFGTIFSEIGTNGYKGGDAGHGSRTYVKFGNVSGSVGVVKIDGETVANSPNDIEIVFEGDVELDCCIEMFEHFVKVLKEQSKLSSDN